MDIHALRRRREAGDWEGEERDGKERGRPPARSFRIKASFLESKDGGKIFSDLKSSKNNHRKCMYSSDWKMTHEFRVEQIY